VVGGVRFYQRREVKDIFSYLRLLVNPQDTVSARRIINVPKRGIGEQTVAALEMFAREEDVPFLEACRRAEENTMLSSRTMGAVLAFVQVMDRLAGLLDDGASPARMVDAASEYSGYIAELEADRTVEAEGRIENLRELVSVAAEFETRGEEGGLPEFLEQVALVSEQDEYDAEASTVTLMTLHNAKGLEFPIVFVVGLEEGVFPHYRSVGDPEQLEEERRLAYVGITRAQERVYLTHAWSRTLWGSTNYNPKSRFLAEIPSDLLREKKSTREKRDGDRSFGGGGGGYGGVIGSGSGGGAVPRVSPPARHDPLVVQPGDTVLHDKWGEGVVVSVSGSGADAQARVSFTSVGEKQLILSYAPLKRT
jgi:DNA helicase-2/ATP-dependent DNA helicase PcrA